MADKKVELLLAPELLKAAKAKAAESDQTLTVWILSLIKRELHPETGAIQPLDWGRIDSRIDQRTAALERKVDLLAAKLEDLLEEYQSQVA